jgi:hypothetical protein
MIAFGTREQADRTRRELRDPETGIAGAKSEWMLSGANPTDSPTIFLVEQGANSVLPAHYHRNNQFQLFVGGSGKIGARSLGPITVHYAGAYTAYGPLAAGPAGLLYFTIRPAHEIGANYVRGAANWPAGPRQHATSSLLTLPDPNVVARFDGPRVTTLFENEKLGLCAEIIQLPADTLLQSPPPGHALAHFVVVLDGELVVQARTGMPSVVRLGRWESLCRSQKDPWPLISAGGEGAQLVRLAMPPQDPAYGDTSIGAATHHACSPKPA